MTLDLKIIVDFFFCPFIINFQSLHSFGEEEDLSRVNQHDLYKMMPLPYHGYSVSELTWNFFSTSKGAYPPQTPLSAVPTGAKVLLVLEFGQSSLFYLKFLDPPCNSSVCRAPGKKTSGALN